MALGVPAVPFTFVVHALGISGLVLVLVWTIDFRGGFAWKSTNKSLIFNVSPSLSLSLSVSLLVCRVWLW
jgi:cytochrome b-561